MFKNKLSFNKTAKSYIFATGCPLITQILKNVKPKVKVLDIKGVRQQVGKI